MKRILAIPLAIIIFLSTLNPIVFAETYTLRNGILFGDSYETVKKKETLTISEKEESILEDGTRQVFTKEGKVEGIDGCPVMFRFDSDDKLYEMKYSFLFLMSKSELNRDYSIIYDKLKGEYGTPIENTKGDLAQVTTIAIDSSLSTIALYQTFGIDADYIDYDEWIVEAGDGNHVKIDMMSFYTSGTEGKTYHLQVGYKYYAD